PTNHRNLICISFTSTFDLRTSNLFRRVSAIDDDILHFADAIAAPMFGGLSVLLRLEAGDRLLEGWKLDHDVAMKILRAFHDPVAAAAREDLGAMLPEYLWKRVRIFLVFDRVIDFRMGNPICRHGRRL